MIECQDVEEGKGRENLVGLVLEREMARPGAVGCSHVQRANVGHGSLPSCLLFETSTVSLIPFTSLPKHNPNHAHKRTLYNESHPDKN